jgi:surfactin synthase thioesterase subunit
MNRPELVPDQPYLWRARVERAQHKLICFPHAGAGAGAYLEWAERMPEGVELLAVQLPGRQERITEELILDVPELIEAVCRGIADELTGDYSFFGHSAGALLAFEVTRALAAAGRPGPRTLFVSGQPAPGGWRAEPVNALPDKEFRDALTELGGIEPEVIADDDIMAMVIPIVRAEFRLWESYAIDPAAVVDTEIVALTGDADHRCPVSSLAGWADHTTRSFERRVYPGGHFYHVDHVAEVTEFVTDHLLKHGAAHG